MFRVAVLLTVLVVQGVFAEPVGLERLMEGNQRFVAGELLHPNRSLERRQETALGQEPFAVIVSCSDSRVSPEVVFDQGIGDIFVVRLAGNVIGSLANESIKYSVHHLHSSIILVLGHENCGAVSAVLHDQAEDVPDLAEVISPSVKSVGSVEPKMRLEAAIKANAMRMRDDLASRDSFKQLLAENKLKIYAGYYHLESGRVEILP